MKEYNCPDCERIDSCESCPRVTLKGVVTTTTTLHGYEIWKSFRENNDLTTVPNTCRACRNHPINGGTGVCHCTLGSITTY